MARVAEWRTCHRLLGQKFADAHHKPFAIPEWGVSKRGGGHGGLDDPTFIQNMYATMTTHPMAFSVYFDVHAWDGHNQLSPRAKGNEVTEFSQSAVLFKKLFGGPVNETAAK